jgi:hypothetical protein
MRVLHLAALSLQFEYPATLYIALQGATQGLNTAADIDCDIADQWVSAGSPDTSFVIIGN